MSNNIVRIKFVEPTEDVFDFLKKVRQISDLEFRFYDGWNLDARIWLNDTLHTFLEKTTLSETVIIFDNKSGAVEFKLRFM